MAGALQGSSRKRRGEGGGAGGPGGGEEGENPDLPPDDPEEDDVPVKLSSRRRARREAVACQRLKVVVVLFATAMGATLLSVVQKYGGSMLLPESWRELRLGDEEAAREAARHRFLFVGGPHRGGTTVLWKCLRDHPEVSGFADSVADESEGMFLQRIYPTFGISAETTTRMMGGRKGGKAAAPRGLGRFAFNPEAHLTEESRYVSEANRLALYRQWGYFWNTSAPVLMEKSPPNMIWGRFLQAMHPGASFVFITRHPVAAALAIRKWDCCRRMSVRELVDHWLHAHKLMHGDLPRLERFQLLHLENFVRQPQDHIDRLCDWMGLGRFAILQHIDRDPNEKYRRQYRAMLDASKEERAAHERMVSELGPEVEKMGYDLREM